MILYLLLQLKRIPISIQWIFLPVVRFRHLSDSTTLPDYKLEGKTYEVTKPVELLDEAFGFKIKTFSTKAEFRQKITTVGTSFTVTGAVNFMACNNVTCSPPKDVEFAIKIADGAGDQIITESNNSLSASGAIRSKGELLKFFLISLLAGFAGVLTPCVFPMIPMTVAFFSRGSENRSKGDFKSTDFWNFHSTYLFLTWELLSRLPVQVQDLQIL